MGSAWGPTTRDGKAVDRLLNFTDAVVAVAITLLALPLVGIGAPQEGESAWTLISENAGQIITFISTFFVVAIMWNVHNRVMNSLETYDSAIFWLSIMWLVGFVLLPWTSGMYSGGEDWSRSGGEPFHSNGTGVLYWGTLAYIAAVGAITSDHLVRHPELIAPATRELWLSRSTSRARFRGWAFSAVFVVAALSTLVYSWLGFYALVLMWPLGRWMRPPTVKSSASAEGEAP